MAIPLKRPGGAVSILNRGRAAMDIILHLGAHRTGTTSFQQYLRANGTALSAAGTRVWDPRHTRKGLFSGLFPGPAAATGRNLRTRAEGRVLLQARRAADEGAKRLLVSDENMIGAPRTCLRHGTLYPAIGERMARISAAFGGQVARVALRIRSPDLWWASVAAYSVARGHVMPSAEKRETIASSGRGWRDVITDLACAMPNTEIMVMPFEQFGHRPTASLSAMTGSTAPDDPECHWLNRSPDLAFLRGVLTDRDENPDVLPAGEGRWQPFNDAQAAALRETYADDLFWLTAGADGLATLTEDPTRIRAGTSLTTGDMQEGQQNDSRQGHMAHSG